MSNPDVIMFDVDVTTRVALFLTNILHLKPYFKKSQSQNCQESLVLLQFYSILQVTSEKIRYFFTVEKYQFYSHLICIEFTACDKIKSSTTRESNKTTINITNKSQEVSPFQTGDQKAAMNRCKTGFHRNSKTQFHDFSMIFYDRQCNFHDFLMHILQPPLLAASSPC